MTALGTVQVIQGNALALPLEDSSVDLICTSPPYFGLRSYQDAGQHYQGQLGSEATPTEFLDALLAATGEMVRVLKPSGSIFVNLGDKYASTSAGSNWHTATLDGGRGRLPELSASQALAPKLRPGVPTKSLMGMPWRYAIACIDQLGLILRAEIIWSKPNGLPESVQDRVRRSHEQWFHFTKQPKYFAAVDEIREEHDPASQRHVATYAGRYPGSIVDGRADGNGRSNFVGNPLGKLPGSVWTIPTQPLTVPPELGIDHFAAYPMEWPRRLIQGWTPTGICTDCGEGRRPITSVFYTTTGRTYDSHNLTSHRQADNGAKGSSSATITGYTCGCPTPTAPTRPSTVLDPFGGTGTTALVAKALGRIGITIDLSADYCRLAEWRCNNPQELAAALQVEKPEVIPADQLSLFGDLV